MEDFEEAVVVGSLRGRIAVSELPSDDPAWAECTRFAIIAHMHTWLIRAATNHHKG